MVIFRKRVPGLSEAALARFVARVASAIKLRGTIHLLVTGNRELQSLNRRFRSKDKPTDVLSFPSAPAPLDNLAGDIAISAEIAAWNAKQLGHSPAEEVKVLALHGVLHLAGYDHENDTGKMARKELQLRRLLGLPEGLTERKGGKVRKHLEEKPRAAQQRRIKRGTNMSGASSRSSSKTQLPKRRKR